MDSLITAAARALVALFQGFLLQWVWGEKLDLEACFATVERIVDGFLAPAASRNSPDVP